MDEPASTLSNVIDVMSRAEKWLVLIHAQPDGDTVGCGLAVASLGRRLGKEMAFGGPDAFPEKYKFLLGDVVYSVFEEIPDSFSDGLIICLDTSKGDRSVKGLLGASGAFILNIDHHGDNSRFGDLCWIDGKASATGEMVTELLCGSGWGITEYEANSLYAALVTDNGNFSFPSSSARSHENAKSLLEAGASPGKIATELETTMSEGMLRLWGRAFSRVEVFSGGLAAIFWLSEADFQETGTTREACENLTNFLLRIRGVKIAALCCGIPDGAKISLRARQPMSAREIAAVFGGGGHNLASGCTVLKPISEVLPALKREMERHAGKFSTVAE
jgi:phosphoesterase RecJ-like protein